MPYFRHKIQKAKILKINKDCEKKMAKKMASLANQNWQIKI
jgi:hypothetical protein